VRRGRFKFHRPLFPAPSRKGRGRRERGDP
jgi:hypothetical protein